MPRTSCFEHELVSDFSDKQLAALRRMSHALPKGSIEWRGRQSVKFQQFCGLIPLGDDVLEILPKLDRVDNQVSSRTALVRMLAFVGDIDIAPLGPAETLSQDELLEIIIRMFADEAANVARRGLPRSYQVEEEVIPRIRGRIDFTRLSRQSPAEQHRVPCRFDELTTNNPVSQYIKAAADRAWRVARRADNRQRIEQVLFLFDGVSSATNVRACSAVTIQNRSLQRFEKILQLSRWIIEAMTPDTQAGKSSGCGLLFDMNLLFERFVQKRLQQSLPRMLVRFQKPQRKLFDATKTFPLKPDIVICDRDAANTVRAIVDAKWKLLGSDGVASGDAYQMVAYATAYQCKRLALLYPHSGNGAEGMSGQHRMHDGTQLDICTISLPNDKDAIQKSLPPWPWIGGIEGNA